MTGKVHAKDAEPVSWTFTRKDGGKSFYTSLGHKDDFANPVFTTMLTNAVYWAAGKTPAKPSATAMNDRGKDWTLVWAPSSIEAALPVNRKDYDGPVWFRTGIRIPEWVKGIENGTLGVNVWGLRGGRVWMNSRQRPGCNDGAYDSYGWMPDEQLLDHGEANLFAVRCNDRDAADQFLKNPVEIVFNDHSRPGDPAVYRTRVNSGWQMQLGDDRAFAFIPLPAQFALPPLACFELPAKQPWEKWDDWEKSDDWKPTPLPGPGLAGPFLDGWLEFRLRCRVTLIDPKKETPLWFGVRLRNDGDVTATINGKAINLSDQDGGLTSKTFQGQLSRRDVKFNAMNDIVLSVRSSLPEKKQAVETVILSPSGSATPLVADWEFKGEKAFR
jgi:hypothetical protein